MILLLLLSLCATECRVHRNDIPVDEQWLCRDAEIQGKPCWVQSHWFSCTVVEKCDTVKLPTWGRYPVFKGDRFFEADSNTYVIRCHPETTLVDSGVVDDGWWFSAPDGKVEIRKPADEDTLWIFDTPFLRSEMPDLKEMLREWRVEKCVDSAYNVDMRAGRWPYYKAIRDSCECVYGKDGGGK